MAIDIPVPLLDLPAPLGARLIAWRLVEDLEARIAGYQDGRDPEALHDLRVAIRRLRSVLVAYQPQLADSIGERAPLRLRDLARATTTARDLEVFARWLRAVGPWAGREESDVMAQIVVQAERRQAKHRERILVFLERDAERLVRRLRRGLGTWRAPISEASRAALPTVARVAGTLLEEHAAALRAALDRVGTPLDPALAHAARIAGKRLRYLLEPLADHLQAASAALQHLRAAQDRLGDWHDAHLFAVGLRRLVKRLDHATLTPFGIQLLERRIEGRRQELAPAVSDLAAGTLRQELDAALEGTLRELATFARPRAEIERKYLLREVPAAVRDQPAVEIVQGYLPGERVNERVRRATGPDGTRYTRTMKYGRGLERIELEDEIDAALFDGLWPLATRRLAKRRWRVPADGLLWEIDEFADRPLVLAEVELPTGDTAVALPAWLAAALEREVTGDPAYDNVTLALPVER